MGIFHEYAMSLWRIQTKFFEITSRMRQILLFILPRAMPTSPAGWPWAELFLPYRQNYHKLRLKAFIN
jgi:hypothetical protein